MSDDETRRAGSPEPGSRLDPTTFERLEAAVAAEPGSPHFPALVEAHRRAGRVETAIRIGRAGLAAAGSSPEGELALVLALYEAGEEREATARLAARLDPLLEAARELPAASAAVVAAPGGATAGFEAELADDELDHAFASAESEPDQMFDVNRVAERVLESEPPDGVAVGDLPLGAASRFATETMASLLERQGDTAAAASIRAGLGAGAGRSGSDADAGPGAGGAVAPAQAAPADAAIVPEPWAGPAETESTQRRERILDTLERWLANIRREVA